MGSILRKLFTKQEVKYKIVFNGLYYSGKTTILYRLRSGQVVPTTPTMGFNLETLVYKNLSFEVWDAGGGDHIRPIWHHYYHGMSALVLVIDSNDRGRLGDARDDFVRFITSETEHFHNVPIAIVCNKQDLPNAASVQEIKYIMDLETLMTGHGQWSMFPTSATTGDGLYEVLEWISDAIKHSGGNVNDKQKQKQTTHNSESILVRSVYGIKNFFNNV